MMDDRSSDDESPKLVDDSTSCSTRIWNFFNPLKKFVVPGGTLLIATGLLVAATPWFLKVGLAFTLAPLVVSKILFAGFFIAAVGVAMIAAGLFYDYYHRSKNDYAPLTQGPNKRFDPHFTEDNEIASSSMR